jgi:rhodanese-related sulfurtransferase
LKTLSRIFQSLFGKKESNVKARISMQDLKKHVDAMKPSEILLDLRTPEEYDAGHIPGSKNIPHDTVAKHAAELKKYESVYMHCRSGGRVQMAAAELERLGLNNLVCVVGSGFPDWQAAGFPVEK